MTALSFKRRATVSHSLRIWQQLAFLVLVVLRRNMPGPLHAALALDFSGLKQLGMDAPNLSRSDAPQIDSAVFTGADCAKRVKGNDRYERSCCFRSRVHATAGGQLIGETPLARRTLCGERYPRRTGREEFWLNPSGGDSREPTPRESPWRQKNIRKGASSTACEMPQTFPIAGDES